MNLIIEAINKNRPLMYVNTVVLFVLVNVIAARLNCRADFTRENANSLTDSTEAVLSKLDTPVLIEAYISRDVPGELVTMLDPNISVLQEIDRVGGDMIQLQLVNPVEEDEKEQARDRGVNGIPIEEARVDRLTQREGFFGLYLQMGDKTTNISLVDRERGRIVEDLEYRFLKEIKRMSIQSSKSGIGLAKAPGAMESRRWQSAQDQNKDNIFGFRTLLERELGFMTEVNLSEGEVPDDVETLLLFGMPRLEEKEIYHIDQFLMRGGSLVCMLKGFDFQFQQQNPQLAQLGLGGPGGGFATVPREELGKLNDWLGKYGITVNGEILFEPELSMAAMDIQGNFLRRVPNPAWAVYSRESGNIVSNHPALKELQQLIFPWFSSLDVKEARQAEVSFSTMIQSSPQAITRDSSSLSLRDIQSIGQEGGDSRVEGPRPVAVLAQGKFRSAFSSDKLPEGVNVDRFRSAQVGDTRGTLAVIGWRRRVA